MAEYSPREIIDMFEAEHGLEAHEIANIVFAFYPTIKTALLLYDEQTGGKRAAPIPLGD